MELLKAKKLRGGLKTYCIHNNLLPIARNVQVSDTRADAIIATTCLQKKIPATIVATGIFVL
jgi:hypothetical protein